LIYFFEDFSLDADRRELRVSNLKNVTPLRRAEDLARYGEGLRIAGLPE
jgi:hypothetical protein